MYNSRTSRILNMAIHKQDETEVTTPNSNPQIEDSDHSNSTTSNPPGGELLSIGTVVNQDDLTVMPIIAMCPNNEIFTEQKLINENNNYTLIINNKEKIRDKTGNDFEDALWVLPVINNNDVQEPAGNDLCDPSTNNDDIHNLVNSNSFFILQAENTLPPSSIQETAEKDPDFEPPSEYDSDDSGQEDLPIEQEGIHYSDREDEVETIDHGDMTLGRKRRLVADPNEWKKNKTKKLRLLGKPYVGYSRSKDGVVKHDRPRKERILLPPCVSKECLRSKTRNCSLISEDDRKLIFNKFWNNMNWDQRKVFVTNHVHKSDPKRIYTKNVESRRNLTLQYHLTVGNKKLQVCKKMFLATICLGEYSVQSWVKSSEHGMNSSKETIITSGERQNSLVRENEDKKKYLRDFLHSLPKLPSHYGRRDSSKLYLENTVQSLAQLLRVYNEKCTEEGMSPVSRPIFNQIFHEMNLSIHQIKKDKCDVCTQHEVGNISDSDWNLHILKKDRARQEKTTDKEAAKEGKCKLLTMDLQAVKVAPCLQASAVFFKTKLSCHNFTVYDLVSHHVKCFWFTECEADLTASTFTTCLIKYLDTYCCASDEKTPIIIFSDGCTYQNRNSILSNALLSYAVENKIGDSVHSCIERKLKGREIRLPSDYLSVTKEARLKPFPYDATMMEYHQFKDYSIKKFHRYLSIRPGKVARDPVVTDIKALQYSPEGRIFYKLNFDDEWSELPHRPKLVPSGTAWPQLFNERRKITLQKWKHLQELKKVIPSDCHHFYDSLPHEIN